MNPAQLLSHFDRISDAPDAIPRLRRFILDLAIRGKLVEQDSRDEPASELLKRILAEKIRRCRVEKVKKVVPPPLEHESFPLPMGWAWTSLADLVTVLNGRAYSQNELLDVGTPVLRVGNLFTSKHWYYSNLELEEDKYCSDGDLIFAWSASFGPFIWHGPKVIYHYHIWKLDLHSNHNLDKHYLYRFLLQKIQEIKESGHGISMIHMTKEKMEKLKIPLPPLAEQRRIVTKVDELIALCDRLEAAQAKRESRRDRLVGSSLHRLNNGADPDAFRNHARFYFNHLPRLTMRLEHIQQLRQTILNLAVRGQFTPATNWPEQPQFLNQFATIQNGYGFKSEWFVSNGVRLLRNANVSHGMIRWDDLACLPQNRCAEFERFQLNAGDIVLSLDRPFIATGTKVARVRPEDLPCLLLQRVGRFQPRLEQLCPDYLFLWLHSPHFTGQVDPGRSNGIPHISSKQVESAEIFIPSLTEQQRIVAKVDELMALCDRLEAQLTTTQTESRRLLEAVLHDALAGQSELEQGVLR